MTGSPKKPALYRDEALQYQRERAWGELIVATPHLARTLAWLVAALAALFVAFVATAEYTRKARAPAVFTYANEPTIVGAIEAGTVTAINVAPGDVVRVGQVLATVSTERSIGGEAVFAAGARDDAARKAAIANERRDTQSQLNAQLAQANARVTAIEAEASQIVREIAAQSDRVAQLQSQIERYRELAKNKFVSDLQVQQKQDEAAEQIVKLETLKRNRATSDRDLANARSEIPTLRANAQTRMGVLNRDEVALAQGAREGLSRRAYDIVAANAGTIDRVIITPGQTVAIGAPILRLQSGADTLVVDAYVPTRSAGFLKTGQSVRLAVDAFPFERFGHVDATITEVSRAVLTPGEIGTPALLKEPSFKVRAALQNASVTAYNATYPLRSGLTAQADIALDKRPLYLWVIEPVLRLKGAL